MLKFRLFAAIAVLALLCACGDENNDSSIDAAIAEPPAAPAIGMATTGDVHADIAFTSPSDNGGASITGYTATCVSGGGIGGRYRNQ